MIVAKPRPPDPPGNDLRRLRVLIPTNREIYRLLSYGMVIDFEDGVAELTDADLLPVPLPSRRARLASARRGRLLARATPPRHRYDVCFFAAMNPQWVGSLAQVDDLPRVAGKVVVYIIDAFLTYLPVVRRQRQVWSHVDHVFIPFGHSLDGYREALPCPVDHLPQAIGDRWFQPHRTERPIDVVSIGRRLPAVHQRLLELSREDDLFYFHQTARAPEAIDLMENQELMGRLLQSSNVHVNWALETTDPQRAEGGGVITARYFESAACAGVVVGSKPSDAAFDELFPHPGFVREIPPAAPEATREVVAAALADAAGRPERLVLAEHTLATHTWKARWRSIVEACGL